MAPTSLLAVSHAVKPVAVPSVAFVLHAFASSCVVALQARPAAPAKAKAGRRLGVLTQAGQSARWWRMPGNTVQQGAAQGLKAIAQSGLNSGEQAASG